MQQHTTFFGNSIRTLPVLVLLLLSMLSLSCMADSTYTVTELQPMTGDVETLAIALNTAGVVVGTSNNEFGQPQAIRWQPDGTPTALISSGRPFSKALDINDSNIIVGVHADESSNILACRWNADLSLDDDLSLLLPSSSSEAVSINNSGDIAGFYINGSGFPHAFLLEGGSQFVSLSFSGAFSSRAFALNQHGDLAGACLGHSAGHGFLKTGQGQNTLPNLPTGSFGEVSVVNNTGAAAGFSDQTDGQEIACFWNNGIVTSIGHLGGGQSRALGMNNFGQVVGSSLTSPAAPQITTFDPNGNPLPQQFDETNNLNDFTNKIYDYETSRAFLWDGSTLQNLNDLIPANSGWVLISAEDINDSGWIVGYGLYNSELRGFLLKPTTPITPQLVVTLPDQQTSIPQTDTIPFQIDTTSTPDQTKLYVNGAFQQNLNNGSVLWNPSSLAFGSHLIRVETLDSENAVTASQEFTINLRDLFLSEWKQRNFGSTSNAASQNESDTDLDGINNLLEFAFNLSPDTSDSSIPHQINLNGDTVQFEFKRRKAFSDQDLTYSIKISENLRDWFDASTFLSMNSQISDGATDPMETVNYEYTGPNADQLFFQIDIIHGESP